MTDQTNDLPEERAHDPSSYQHPDAYLQAFIDIANQNNVEFPITLFVRGTVISGQLVGGRDYFDGLAIALTEGFGGPTKENLALVEDLVSWKQIYVPRPPDTKADPIHYIHLRDARVFAPGQKPMPEFGSWWRGRVSSVDGFHFGALTAS